MLLTDPVEEFPPQSRERRPRIGERVEFALLVSSELGITSNEVLERIVRTGAFTGTVKGSSSFRVRNMDTGEEGWWVHVSTEDGRHQEAGMAQEIITRYLDPEQPVPSPLLIQEYG